MGKMVNLMGHLECIYGRNLKDGLLKNNTNYGDGIKLMVFHRGAIVDLSPAK